MSGIQRIQSSFKKSKAFVGYVTAGDGGIQYTLEVALALIEGGVTMLEIGVPFSDPVADGPVIQRASARALQAGTSLKDILWLAQEIRKKSEIPLILFSYLNPLLAELNSSLLEKMQRVGIDGLLIVDCPLEELAHSFRDQCLKKQIAPIFLIAPSTSLTRIQQINQQGKGFLYYVCRKGTTGIRSELPNNFAGKMQLIKENVDLPVITGFGIANRATAIQALKYADGAVIASLFVKAIEDGISSVELKNLTQSINPLRGN